MKRICLLFIDDDRYKSKPLIDYFVIVEDWSVRYEPTPAGAMRYLKDNVSSVDVILLDVMMPPDEAVDIARSEMGQATGILLLDKLSELTRGAIPVVILSARQDLQYLQRDGRVSRYLQKPQTAVEIVQAIKEVAHVS